jgi:hypothetical protein
MNDIEKAIDLIAIGKGRFLDRHDIYAAMQDGIEALKKQLNGGWIPVSERLPDNNTKVQVTGVRYSEYTKKNIYVRFNAKYIGKHSIKVDDMWPYCEDYTWNDYVEEEDEYYVNEGWYETIENWDDYTEVYVNDYKVIAWQLLPEPYKEVE